jgi:hypothetical protein
VLQSITARRNLKFRQCAIVTPPRTPCAAAKLKKDRKEKRRTAGKKFMKVNKEATGTFKKNFEAGRKYRPK